MDKAKLILVFCASAVLCSCSRGFEITWEKFTVDGHRTGVTAVRGSDIASALGTIDSLGYHSPSGKTFDPCSSTAQVASALISLQPRLAYLKEIVGESEVYMAFARPECALGNWAADMLRTEVAKFTGKRIDVAILNLGGIRVSMPDGPVLKDDIYSMFPFRNYLCSVTIRGVDLKNIFAQMAANRFDAISGARIVCSDGKLVSAEVGGVPVDDRKLYNVATIDFLLDGGDGYRIAKNAVAMNTTGILLKEAAFDYIDGLTQRGEKISGAVDGRITLIK